MAKSKFKTVGFNIILNGKPVQGAWINISKTANFSEEQLATALNAADVALKESGQNQEDDVVLGLVG